MRLGNRVFRPGWMPALATLLLLPVLVALGLWQLDRARQKAELQAAFAEHLDRPPVPLADLNVADPASRYRRIIASGQYDGTHQVLLDNQVRDGQPGYHVLTPLRLAEGGAILVNRGWLAVGESRQVLPNLATPEGPVTVSGWLGQPANPGLRLNENGEASRWPRVVPYVDYERLAARLGYPLQPALILLEPEAPYGYERDWQPRFGGFGPERHRGYAVQWFALAAALVILYVAAHARRPTSSE